MMIKVCLCMLFIWGLNAREPGYSRDEIVVKSNSARYSKWKKNTKTNDKQPEKDLYHMVVASDGSGDFITIQEAINNAKSFPDRRVVIEVKKGVYREKVKVHAWNPKISLIGEDPDSTIITFDDHFNSINLGRNSTFFTATLQVDGDDFYASGLTVENSAGPVGQAIALAVNANRVKIENCRLLGHQDTLYTAGEGSVQYFKQCYIEGTTDFIFGGATVFFEACTIHSKANSYITAASTPKGINYGYVFKTCRLTADEGVVKVFLGRPWRTFAKTVFIDCWMGEHIAREGWDNWSNPEAETKTFYAESGSYGPGGHTDQRVSWAHRLSGLQQGKFNKKNVLEKQTVNNKDHWYEERKVP